MSAALTGVSLVFLVVMTFALLFVRAYVPTSARGNPPGTGTLRTKVRRWRRFGGIARPLVLAVLASCSGSQPAAHPWLVRVDAALTVAAHAADAADAIAAQRYTAESGLHDVDLDALDRRYQPLATVRRLARDRIVEAEHALADGECPALVALRLALLELRHLAEAFALLGVSNAPAIAEGITALGDVVAAAPLCPGEP